jgi:hypothetical protein
LPEARIVGPVLLGSDLVFLELEPPDASAHALDTEARTPAACGFGLIALSACRVREWNGMS